jgi:RNA polymerase sigma-70 factor (ECF subfamily)
MTENADRLFERLLVLRCQAGDEEAFAQLVERYQPGLRYYLGKMLFGVCEADDVLQEVWLEVYRSIARLNDADAFRAWLYQVARRRAIKLFRRRRLQFESLEDVGSDELGAEADAFAAEEVRGVHRALDELPAAQREVLVLRYVEGMSYEEIARVVDCEVGTVRSRLHYAKRAVRIRLERKAENPRQGGQSHFAPRTAQNRDSPQEKDQRHE